MARLDIDAAELARCCGMPEAALYADEREIPLHGFVSALEFIADTGRCRDFGWQAGKAFDVAHLGDLGEAVSCAPTLGTALQVFARYLRLIQSTSEITFDVDADQLVLGYRILDPGIWPRCQDAEFTISILCAIIRGCLGEGWRPLYVGFEHQPGGDTGARDSELSVACAYSCDVNTIALPVRVLDEPMPCKCHADWPAAFSRLGEAVARRDRARPLPGRVRTAIFSEMSRGLPRRETVAARLGVSQRTLHRRLQAAGTSYGAILSDCRASLGRFLLQNAERPLSQVAHDLGYSDYTAFSRAFRACYGHTPKAFRDRNEKLAEHRSGEI